VAIVKNVLGLVLIYYFKWGWEGLIVGHLIGYFIFATYSLFSFLKQHLLTMKLKYEYVRDVVIVGAPLSLHRVGIWLGNMVNRILVMSILGAAATGSYGIGATFGMIITIVEDSITKAFVPILFEKLNDLNEKKSFEIVKLTYSFYVFLVLISVAAVFVGYFGVGIIFGKSFEETRIFIIPIVFASMFKGFYKLHVNYIFFTKKSEKITKVTFVTGVFNIVLAYVMIRNFGLIGAAYSLLILNIVQYVFSFYIGNQLISMPWVEFFKRRIVV
jgi:O-antigen/teichoic acid export membrane protein